MYQKCLRKARGTAQNLTSPLCIFHTLSPFSWPGFRFKLIQKHLTREGSQPRRCGTVLPSPVQVMPQPSPGCAANTAVGAKTPAKPPRRWSSVPSFPVLHWDAWSSGILTLPSHFWHLPCSAQSHSHSTVFHTGTDRVWINSAICFI